MPGIRRALSHPLALLLLLGLILRPLAPLAPWGIAFAEDRGGSVSKDEDKGGADKGDDKDKGDKGDKGGKGGNDKGGKDDKGGNDKGGKDDKGGNDKNNDNRGGNPQGPGDQERRSYYAQVTVNDGRQVYIGTTRLVSDSPWLRLAAPGMWLEANGRWDGNAFRADEVRIVSPKAWAFYQGPAAPLVRSQSGPSNPLNPLAQYQYVETWLQDDPKNRFISVKAAPDLKNQIRLIVYFDGKSLAALPAGFPVPIPAGFKPGWLEMTGEWNGQTITWNSLKSFP